METSPRIAVIMKKILNCCMDLREYKHNITYIYYSCLEKLLLFALGTITSKTLNSKGTGKKSTHSAFSLSVQPK